MSGYEPTGGDGRYSRLYLRNLTPDPETLAGLRQTIATELPNVALRRASNDALAQAELLAHAVAEGDPAAATRIIRRLIALGTAVGDYQGGAE